MQAGGGSRPSHQQSQQKTLPHLPQKHKAQQFPNDFCAPGDVLFCNVCQHKVEWNRVDL